MFVKYVSKSASGAWIAGDLAMLACGYSVNALSDICDKAATQIISNAVAPGWTLVDDQLNDGSVISCRDADDIHTKIVKIYTTNGTIAMQAIEAWNSVTHGPAFGYATSPANVGGAYPALSGATTFWMIVTPRTIYIFRQNAAAPFATGVGSVEFTRDAAYLKGTTYPAHAIITSLGLTSGSFAATTKMKNLAAAGDLTGIGTGEMIICTMAPRSGAGSLVRAPAVLYRDALDNPYYEVRPVWIGWNGAPGSITRPLILGRLYDFVETASIPGNLFNTFTDGVDTWTIVTGDDSNPNACLALKAV